jgi:hypothetical protein
VVATVVGKPIPQSMTIDADLSLQLLLARQNEEVSSTSISRQRGRLKVFLNLDLIRNLGLVALRTMGWTLWSSAQLE